MIRKIFLGENFVSSPALGIFLRGRSVNNADCLSATNCKDINVSGRLPSARLENSISLTLLFRWWEYKAVVLPKVQVSIKL